MTDLRTPTERAEACIANLAMAEQASVGRAAKYEARVDMYGMYCDALGKRDAFREAIALIRSEFGLEVAP